MHSRSGAERGHDGGDDDARKKKAAQENAHLLLHSAGVSEDGGMRKTCIMHLNLSPYICMYIYRGGGGGGSFPKPLHENDLASTALYVSCRLQLLARLCKKQKKKKYV